jgi:hypothetical protein
MDGFDDHNHHDTGEQHTADNAKGHPGSGIQTDADQRDAKVGDGVYDEVDIKVLLPSHGQ